MATTKKTASSATSKKTVTTKAKTTTKKTTTAKKAVPAKTKATAEVKTFDFGEAIKVLKSGKCVARLGWNGKGIFIKLMRPTPKSSMTQPYIYIVTTGLESDNPNAKKGKVPWLASQTDMLAEDWIEVTEK